MTITLLVLSICSIFIGYVFFESFIGLGSNFFNNSIYINYFNETNLNSEFSLYIMKYVPLILVIISSLCFYIYIDFYEDIYIFFINNINLIFFYKIVNKAFFFDILYGEIFFKKFLELSYFIIYKYVEKGFFYFFINYSISNTLLYIYNLLKNIYTGLIYDYIFLILVSIIYIVMFYLCLLFLDFTGLLILYFGIFYFINNEESFK